MVDMIRKRDMLVSNNRAYRGFEHPSFASRLNDDASVYARQETVSQKSLWIPLQRYKKDYEEAKLKGYAPDDPPPVLGVDTGTEFVTAKASYSNTHENVTKTNYAGSLKWFFMGPVRAYGTPLVTVAGSSYYPSLADLFLNVDRLTYIRGKGTTAIRRTVPTNPLVDVSTTLGEIRKDGLPKLVGLQFLKNGGSLRSAGSEYLNFEFGIKPIVNDIKSLSQSIINNEKIIAQLERDSGRVVRRKYHFPITETVEPIEQLGVTQVVGAFPSTALFDNDSSQITGPLTRTKKTTERLWFSGAYMYHFDRGVDLRTNMLHEYAKARKLFGLKYDLETLYNLTGWTWLFDWFTNAGDVMSNLSAFGSDSLVLKYGYIMCETKVEHIYTHTSPAFGAVTTTYGSHQKVRLKANPYGFGSDLTNLTPRQIAILVALGLTHQQRY